jgi:hypothetical protein
LNSNCVRETPGWAAIPATSQPAASLRRWNSKANNSSLLLIASGLLGPALAPLFVGLVSDGAAAAQIPNGLGLGLLIGPVASAAAGVATLVANRRIATALSAQARWTPAFRS